MPETKAKGDKKNGQEVWREWGIAIGLAIIAAAIVFFYVRYFDGGGGGVRATLRSIDGGYSEERNDGETVTDAA